MDHRDFLVNLNGNLKSESVEEFKNEEFSLAVASGQVKFLSVVESIQEILTNKDVRIRERGIEFLSWLLLKLPKELFNNSEISVLLNFYCDCLKENHNFVPPAVRGLLELVKMKHITKEDLIKVLVNLFQYVNCQTQLQPDRVIIYSIFKFIIENYLEDVKLMGLDFVFGIISLIEGEADPFCLIIIFNFLPILIKNSNSGHLEEEMFELLSYYFPIDFNSSNPSSKKNFTITREDLSEGLHQCLSANNSFSEQSISLILEKAQSKFKNAKLDSYKLLKLCCKTLKVENLEKHINSLWKILSDDLLLGYEEQVCDAGLSALTEIFYLFSQDESHQNILFRFLDDIMITIKSLANKIDENLFQPAIKVLISAASRSKPAARRVLCHLKTFSELECSVTSMEQKIVLSSLLPLLSIYNELKIAESLNYEEKTSYLQLVNLYLNSTTSIDYEIRELAFLGVLDILSNCNEEFHKALYEIILENIRTKDDIRTSDKFVQVWRKLAQKQPQEFFNFISANFVDKDTGNHFSNYLWALSYLSDIPKFTNYVISILISVIDGRRNFVVALESLLNACKFSKSKEFIKFFQVLYSEHNVIERLILWCLQFKPIGELYEGKCLFLLSEIIARIIRNQDTKVQQIIANEITPMLLNETPQLNGSRDFTPSDKNLIGLSHDLVHSVLILEAVLGSVCPEVIIPMIRTLQEKLTHLALNSTIDSIRLSSSRLLASFVNKAEESLALDLLNAISKDIFAQLEEDCELKLKLNSSFLFTWVTKAIVLRGGRLSKDWIPTWFSLLERNDIGEAIAEGFRTVIEESDLYLNLESHCNFKVLYRQELFGNHSKLVEMFEMSEISVRMNYLLALVLLLRGVPLQLIQMEISSLISILIRCLDSGKSEILLSALEILVAVLESKEEIFTDHTISLVPKFLKLATFEGCMKIRIKALKCLYFYGFYPTHILLRLRSRVIRDLGVCLDDKKRLVRKEAVRARCRWFLIGAHGEDMLDLPL